MKFELMRLFENIGGKNKKLFDENSENISTYVKRQQFDIRPAKAGEKIHVTMSGAQKGMKTAKDTDYFVRNHDEIKQINLIDKDEFDGFEPVQPGAEPDAEGFITYREVGQYEAFKHEGENVYIFTDWNTKQNLKTGDFLVKPAGNETASGFVVSAIDFDKHFEEVQ